MNRDRLKQVHQTELTESRVNQDFVDWLKTKGPSWLLVVLVGICGYLGILRWKQYRANHVSEAWAALQECRLPGSFEDVAAKYDDVPGLPERAKLAGADALLRAVQIGQPIGTDPVSPVTTPLTAGERSDYLQRAERLYRDVSDDDDGTLATTLNVVSALQGLAVVAESGGDAAEARRLYEAAATRAGSFYPALAERLRGRAGTAETYAREITLPATADLPASVSDDLDPVAIDEALRDLLLPDESDAG